MYPPIKVVVVPPLISASKISGVQVISGSQGGTLDVDVPKPCFYLKLKLKL